MLQNQYRALLRGSHNNRGVKTVDALMADLDKISNHYIGEEDQMNIESHIKKLKKRFSKFEMNEKVTKPLIKPENDPTNNLIKRFHTEQILKNRKNEKEYLTKNSRIRCVSLCSSHKEPPKTPKEAFEDSDTSGDTDDYIECICDTIDDEYDDTEDSNDLIEQYEQVRVSQVECPKTFKKIIPFNSLEEMRKYSFDSQVQDRGIGVPSSTSFSRKDTKPMKKIRSEYIQTERQEREEEDSLSSYVDNLFVQKSVQTFFDEEDELKKYNEKKDKIEQGIQTEGIEEEIPKKVIEREIPSVESIQPTVQARPPTRQKQPPEALDLDVMIPITQYGDSSDPMKNDDLKEENIESLEREKPKKEKFLKVKKKSKKTKNRSKRPQIDWTKFNLEEGEESEDESEDEEEEEKIGKRRKMSLASYIGKHNIQSQSFKHLKKLVKYADKAHLRQIQRVEKFNKKTYRDYQTEMQKHLELIHKYFAFIQDVHKKREEIIKENKKPKRQRKKKSIDISLESVLPPNAETLKKRIKAMDIKYERKSEKGKTHTVYPHSNDLEAIKNEIQKLAKFL